MFIDKFLNFINQDDKDIFNFFTSLENMELYFNQITKIQKKIVIHKIANEEIKLYMLNKYSYLFSQDELDYLLEKHNYKSV